MPALLWNWRKSITLEARTALHKWSLHNFSFFFFQVSLLDAALKLFSFFFKLPAATFVDFFRQTTTTQTRNRVVSEQVVSCRVVSEQVVSCRVVSEQVAVELLVAKSLKCPWNLVESSPIGSSTISLGGLLHCASGSERDSGKIV